MSSRHICLVLHIKFFEIMNDYLFFYRRVRTLYACLAENDGELSFEPNQIITNGKPNFVSIVNSWSVLRNWKFQSPNGYVYIQSNQEVLLIKDPKYAEIDFWTISRGYFAIIICWYCLEWLRRNREWIANSCTSWAEPNVIWLLWIFRWMFDALSVWPNS